MDLPDKMITQVLEEGICVSRASEGIGSISRMWVVILFHILFQMEQLDDEPEHLDTVVAFPTDFTVGGLPADRKNIYKMHYL